MNKPQVPLAHFRAEAYQTFGLRRDALGDLVDAVVTGSRVSSLVQYSLTPSYAHRWPSIFDALAQGTIDVAALRRRFVATLPAPEPDQRPLWVIDGTTWPRPEARTSPERTCCRFVTGGTPESGIVAGWEYQWVIALPETRGSWVLPLDLRRRSPGAGTPTELAVAQLRDLLADYPTQAPRPVIALDSHYDVPQLARAGLPIDLVARLARNRRFYRHPARYSGAGRPRTHGPVFRLNDPATQGRPDLEQTAPDDDYGWVVLERWDDLHAQPAPDVPVTVLRITVGHLPGRETPPKPMWLCWRGIGCPADLRILWRWYRRRFAVEHGFRFLKQEFGWTRAHLTSPAAADRWSWLLAIALWHLFLARPLVEAARLPWERHPPAGHQLSPGRVRRAMAALIARLSTPPRSPQPRGKSPGRRAGTCPGRRPRYPVVKRGPPSPA